MPNKEEKFDKKLKSLISSAYTYNADNLIRPKFYWSNWRESQFKNYFSNGNYHPLEGVYEGDNYKVGIKQGTDGKFYVVYLSGASNTYDWTAGDIKAILEPTATPTVFKAQWFGKWKQKMNFTIIFKDGLMTTYDEDKDQEAYIKLYPALLSQQENQQTNEWSGTGFALKNGYIVTNYHVIEGAATISLQGVKGDFDKSYNATVVASDKSNDLALLKITDSSFYGFGNIPYAIASSTSEVGEDIYVLGYPLTSTMGDEIKLTTGVISSKTGFQGDVSLYQISAPIQPGNSGGPLFNKKGNIIGVVSAKHADAENVGYAIKASYLRNLIESAENTAIIPINNTVSTLPLTGKVKVEKNFVFYIKCSTSPISSMSTNNTKNTTNPNGTRIINAPHYTSKADGNLSIDRITLSSSQTILECSSTNPLYNGWMNISRDAYILASGYRFQLIKAEGIEYSPKYTHFAYPNQTLEFTLYFPAIPSHVKSIDFIESQDSAWKIFGIKLN